MGHSGRPRRRLPSRRRRQGRLGRLGWGGGGGTLEQGLGSTRDVSAGGGQGRSSRLVLEAHEPQLVKAALAIFFVGAATATTTTTAAAADPTAIAPAALRLCRCC